MKHYNVKWLLPVLAALLFASCENVSHYPIDPKPAIRVQHDYLGIWSSPDDKDKHNYFVVTNTGAYYYQVTYMDKSGTQAGEQMRAFMSDVDGTPFLNIEQVNETDTGYMLFRILQHRGNEIRGTMVQDTTLKQMKNAAELRMLVARNLNNRKFYGDTIRLIRRLPLNYCR